MITIDEVIHTIDNLKIIQNILLDAAAEDEDCEQVEEIQNTIYILEELL
jgi:hypothetical protein